MLFKTRTIHIELNLFPKDRFELHYSGYTTGYDKSYSQLTIHINFEESNRQFYIKFTPSEVAPQYLPLNFIKIDGYIFNSNLESLLIGKYTYEYSDILMRFAYKSQDCNQIGCEYKFLIPDDPQLKNYNSYTPVLQCQDLKRVVHYGDSITIENKALISTGNQLYEYTSVEYSMKNKYFNKIIQTIEGYGNFYYTGNKIDTGEGYIDIITFTAIRNGNTRDCSGIITLIICQKNCYSCNEDDYCISCMSGYAFDVEKKQCIEKKDFKSKNENGIYKNYYFDKGYNTIKPCYYSCGSCLSGPDKEKHNCQTCRDNSYYSRLFKDFTLNCYEKECYFYGLYEKDNKRCVKDCEQYISLDKKKCVSKCEENNFIAGNQCTNECNSEYPFLLEEEKKCLHTCGSYYETKDGKCVKVCPEKYPYKLVSGSSLRKCTNKCEESIIYKYKSEDLKRCFKECPFYAIREEYKCVSDCPEEYPYKSGKFCVKRCEEGTFWSEENKICVAECKEPYFGYKGKCVEICPDDFPFYSTKNTRLCVESCEEEGYQLQDFNKRCLNKCKESNLVRLNNNCVLNCPAEFLPISKNDDVYCSFFLDEITDSNGIKKIKFYSLEKILNTISLYPKEYLAKTFQILGENYYLEIYSGQSQTYKRNLEYSVVDVSEYTQEIAKKNFISPKSMLTVKIEKKEANSTTNKVYFQFYSNEGKNLTDELKQEEAKYNSSVSISNIALAKINLAKRMKEKNFDIFNSEDRLFNDVCLNYSIDNVDLSVKDRRKLYFQSIDFCQKGCKYISSDLKTKRVNCECGSEISNPKFSYVNSNFLLLKCNKNFLNTRIIGKNLLFITGVILVILMISTAIYSLIEIPKRNSKITELLAPLQNPPIKDNSGNDLINSYKSIEKNSSSRRKDFQKEDTIKNDEEEEENNDPILGGLIFNINNISFEKARKYDNRAISKAFWSTFCNKQIFLRPFFLLSKFESRTFNLCFGFFLFSLLFEINMLFFSPNFISDIFKNEGKVKYNYVFLNSFFSLICEILIYKFISYRLNDAFYLEFVLIEVKSKETLYSLLSEMMEKIKKKTLLCLFFFIGFSIFFWYHLSMFPFVYQNSQKNLYIQCWFSFFLSFIFYALISFVLTISRILGIKLNSRRIYSISFFFNYF